MHGDHAPASDNWQRIVTLLHELPASGPDGFEGLVALLLEAITGKPFFVALSGRQPQGDAITHDARISMQAKRYGPQTSLSSNQVAADFLSVCDAVAGRLDVYVVAVTRESAQLRRDLEVFERNTGVDIVVLADEAGRPELSALCVACWPKLKRFFPNIPTRLETWITDGATAPLVLDVVARTQSKVGESLNTFSDLLALARAALAKKFRTPRDRTAAGVNIMLGDAVERLAPRTALFEWWRQTKQPCAYLEAQEGCGKSWVAAAFAEHLVATDPAPVVLWLESFDWSGCVTLDAVVNAALGTVLPERDSRAGIFAEKIFRLWPRPVLLILDGVNEHGCLEASQRLLRHYDQHAAHYADHLRLLFTTRPLRTYEGYWPDTWTDARCIPLRGFTDPEFVEALRRFAPDIAPGTIPPNVRNFAAVPRFFRLAIHLKDRLRDLGQLTKPLLLFEDLMDKIEHDPQLKKLFFASPEATLAHLAQHSQPLDATSAAVSVQHFTECFPSFASALNDLAEQRLVLRGQIGSVVIHNDHVVLGFALRLLHLAEANPHESEFDLRDRFAVALEPNREDDSRTEALYVALLLTLWRQPPAGQNWQATRRALLILWCGGHNARRTPDRLAFWARADLPAYRRVVESLFARYLSGAQDTELITPVAARWREAGLADAAVTQLLTHWLTLVYPTTDSDDTPEEAQARAGFPHAETHRQLRLAFAAISILSLRPEDEMLPALIRCAHSCTFCKALEEMNGKPRELSLKTPYANLGILLRWNYTDTVVPKLIALATANVHEPATMAGLRTLGECLDLAEIPLALRRPEPPYVREERDESPATIVKGFRNWIHHLPSAQSHWPSIWHLELLVDHAAAELDARDIEKLRTDLSRVLATTAGQRVGRDGVAELFPHLFPWLARFAPEAARQLTGEYWRYALRSANPAGAAMDAPVLPLEPGVLAGLVEEARAAVARSQDANVGFFLTRLSKLFLLSRDEAVILNWFDVMLTLPASPDGEEWRTLPVPYMLEQITTPSLATACWDRFERAAREFPEQRADRRVIYWLTLYATLVRGDAAAARQALALARGLAVNHPWAVDLFQIVAASNDAAVVDAALVDPAFRQHFENAQATHHFAWFLRLPPATRLSDEVRRLLSELPPTVAAELLRWTNSDDEHLAFARLLAESAMRRATNPTVLTEPGYELGWTRPHDDHRAWWHFEEIPAGSHTHHSDLSSVWGVDRGQMSDWGSAFDDDGAAGRERVRQLNDASKRGFAKMKAIADQYLVRFHAQHTLDHWGRLKPEEFRAFATAFFAALAKNSGGYFELSLVCDEVLSTLCRIDVAAAARLHDGLFGDARGAVKIDGMIPSFAHRLMGSDLDSQASAINSLRAQLITRNRSDHEVLGLVMAAIHGQTLSWLRAFVRDQLVSSPLAKDRAIAVSVLAFAETDEDRDWLAQIADTDPSQWVREHAEWALSVHDQGAIARRVWQETLTEIRQPAADLLGIATRLVRLSAVLPPTAIYWDRPLGPSPTANALVLAFWYAWQNRGGVKAERAICDRKLSEYFCGQKLDDVTKRMAPWWNPDDQM